MTLHDLNGKNGNGSHFRNRRDIMASGSNYKTKQREIMLAYLESRPGVHITAADVYDHFRAQGVTIGQSTVYRQLEKFVDDGILNKYVLESGRSACFEYVGMSVHKKNETCFHCKCEKCGKLIHLKCEELEEIGKHLYSEHKFKLDPLRTVFYGMCDDCLESKA